jgi:hypothetical protein
MPLASGTHVGQYEILAAIGKGGMGVSALRAAGVGRMAAQRGRAANKWGPMYYV